MHPTPNTSAQRQLKTCNTTSNRWISSMRTCQSVWNQVSLQILDISHCCWALGPFPDATMGETAQSREWAWLLSHWSNQHYALACFSSLAVASRSPQAAEWRVALTATTPSSWRRKIPHQHLWWWWWQHLYQRRKTGLTFPGKPNTTIKTEGWDFCYWTVAGPHKV